MQINVAQAIDRSSIGAFHIRLTLLCGLVILLDGFDNQAMAVVAPALAKQWQLPVSSLAPVLSSSLAGLMAGTLLGGPAGDRFGRRFLLLVSFALMGVAALLTARADSIAQLLVLRFITGLGLGGCLPNAIALTSEYGPVRWRGLMVTIILCGMTLGGTLAATVASTVLETYGWRAVFIVGGVLPLVIWIALWVGLPESIRFLVVRNSPGEKVGRILASVDRSYRYAPAHEYFIEQQAKGGISVRQLFTDNRAVATTLLWIVFFCNLSLFYLMLSWLPSVFTQAGWPAKNALHSVSYFQMGGLVGGLALGWLSDRFGIQTVLIPVYVVGAVLVASIGMVSGSISQIEWLIAFAGAAIIGSQFGLNALSAILYPTDARATGVGWALGIGRIGAIISPLLGGWAVREHWGPHQLFPAASVAALVCAAAMFLLRRVTPAHTTGSNAGH